MKKLLTILALGPVLFSFTRQQGELKPLHTLASQATYRAAVRVTQSEFDQLTAEFRTANSENTLGGMIGKMELKNMIASMPSSDVFVNFRFATDATTGRVSVMFMGGKSWYEGKRKIDCLRNGGSAGAFCPSICDLNATESRVTVDIDYNTYNDLSAAYQRANPTQTWGGNIDKSAMLDLINSMPESASNIAFRFCKDGTFGKMAVIFAGGKQGIETFYIRNGVTAEAFCPSMCSVRN